MTFQRVAGGRWRPRCRRSQGQQCVSAELNYYLGGGGCSQHSRLTCFLIRSQPAEGTKGPGCGSPLHAPLLSLQEQCPEREAWIKRPSSDTGSPVPAPPTPVLLLCIRISWGGRRGPPGPTGTGTLDISRAQRDCSLILSPMSRPTPVQTSTTHMPLARSLS